MTPLSSVEVQFVELLYQMCQAKQQLAQGDNHLQLLSVADGLFETEHGQCGAVQLCHHLTSHHKYISKPWSAVTTPGSQVGPSAKFLMNTVSPNSNDLFLAR